jgi:serine/threonine protein kinase
MALASGTRLGYYEVVAPIGAGGMGEVYQAHDTKLGRDVAIKVLPEAFAHDPERLSRFQREAKMLASLNHPNIATIHGLEQSGDTSYLVMELVSGEMLAERVKAGPLGIEEALKIAVQIAEALEAAHEKSIIHRDLKPANVKVTPEGKVKVLDFGLAKAFSGDAANDDPSNSPTLSAAATMQGVILGTAAYMSPEQAKGKPVTKATDIWAFGCMLYELLTGKAAFHGEDVTDILAAVVRAEPDWNRLPKSTPQSIRLLLMRCLRKDRRQRLQDATDVRIEIADALSGVSASEPAPAAARHQLPFIWLTLCGVLLLALTALSLVHFRETPPEQSSIRFQMSPPEKTTFLMFRLSPDGRRIAFTAFDSLGKSMLWVRSLDTLAAQSLAGTDGATYPFWAPDSAQIAFFAQGKLRKIAAAGGPALTICDAVNGRGGTWNRDGVILFTPTIVGGLYRVPDTGGAPVPVTQVVDAGDNDRFPEFLPDGRRFLFFRASQKDRGVYAGSLNGTDPVRILPDESNAQYVASGGGRGYLILRRENTLVAQPFDPERLQITGGIVPIAEYVGIAGNTGYGAFSASGEGTLVYGAGNGSSNRQLVWLDRTGKRLSVISKPDAIGNPALSPNGKTASFVIGNVTAVAADIWLQDLERGALSRFTFGPGSNGYPVWSPDGRTIVFTTTATAGSYDIYQKTASGAGNSELVFHGGNFSNSTQVDDWSADGKFIVFSNRNEKTKDDLWLLPMAGDRKPVPFLQTPSNENLAQFSPDGNWMAYQSDETGRYEIYVQHIPPNGTKFQISATGGASPRWRRDGKELFYLAPGPKLMALSVKTGPVFEPAQARVLFESVPIAIAGGTGGFRFQPSPDGQRFLALVEAEGDLPAAPPITITTNWTMGLKK